jgi:hypothetical protein
MVHRRHFNVDDIEATEEELRDVGMTAISILGLVVVVLVLVTIFIIT